ncbi:MAG: diaminopimelate epimerase [Chthoniobacter sp.]|jgi:diaminopimelate epimerase|nr:diaminopimelate epimerase [Chthoniobacter sp.]
MLTFTKMNGAGNDFVMLDNRDGSLALEKAQIARLCDRHRGVGGDGLLVVEPAQDGADFRMRYYNADGGEAEMCGNGARCFARFAQRVSGKTGEVAFETIAGVITAKCLGDLVQIEMSEPHSLKLGEQLEAAGERLTVHSINTGVPHAVILEPDLEAVEVRKLGAALRYHAHFAPKGTNVNFVKQLGPQSIAIRTYERGVEDETLACGTGMVASALIFHELTGAASPVRVQVRGGDTLEIAFEQAGARYQRVKLTGPADFTFEGQVAL